MGAGVANKTSLLQRTSVIYALVIVLSFVCYWSGLTAPQFLQDDHALWQGTWSVWDDPAGVIRIWSGEVHPSELHSRPVADTVVWAGMQVWGDSVIAFRVLLLLIHLCTVLLAIKMFKSMRVPGAEWVGLVIACHPLFVQQVLWIAQVRGALANLFVVAGMWAFVNQHQRQSVRSGLLALLFVALGVLSKTTAVAFPLLLVLVGMICRIRPTRQTWSFAAASVVVAAAGGMFDKLVVEQGPHLTVAMGQRLEATVLGFLQGWRNLWIPHPLAWTYEFDISLLEVICAVSVVPAFVALWRYRGRWEALRLLLIVALFLAIIGPVVVSPVFALLTSPIQDRYISLGVFVVAPYVAYLLAPSVRRGSRSRPYAIAALVVLAALLCVASARQARLYTDVNHFYGEALRVTPDSVDLRLFWSNSLRQAGKHDDAYRVLNDTVAFIAAAKQRVGDPSAPAQYRRYDERFLQETEMAVAIELAQVQLLRGFDREVLARLPDVENPDFRQMWGLPLSALHAALRLESADSSVRDEVEGAKLVTRAVLEQVAFESSLHPDRRHWCRLRLKVLRASVSAAQGQFETARQLVSEVLADPFLSRPGSRRARVRDDLRQRLHAYEQRTPFRNPKSQMLWRLNTWTFLLW